MIFKAETIWAGKQTLVSLINIDWIIRDHLRLSAISCLDLPSPGLGFPYFVSLHNTLLVTSLLTSSIHSRLGGDREEQEDEQEASILIVYCDASCTHTMLIISYFYSLIRWKLSSDPHSLPHPPSFPHPRPAPAGPASHSAHLNTSQHLTLQSQLSKCHVSYFISVQFYFYLVIFRCMSVAHIVMPRC